MRLIKELEFVSQQYFKVLHPLTLADKPLFDQYAHTATTRLSSYAFAALYIWRDLFQFYWTIIDHQLCVFAAQGDDYFMPIMPIGGQPSERAVSESYAFMLEANRAVQIARIENVPEELLPFFRQIGFHAAQKETEYLYETETLIHLKGNRYKSKRSAYNAFTSGYPYATLEPYHPDDLADCLALYDLWQLQRRTRSDDPLYHSMLDDSRHAHRTGLMNATKLGLSGGVVRIDGELKGYTVGYPLNEEVFCVLFEVTHPQLKGLAQFIYREFCRQQSCYRWINALDDSGLANLKRVKLSYHPIQLAPSYNVFLPLDGEARSV